MRQLSWAKKKKKKRNCHQSYIVQGHLFPFLRTSTPSILPPCVFPMFLIIFYWRQLLYNTVLVSTLQQSGSAVHIHIFPPLWISFPFRSLHSTEQSTLSNTQVLICYLLCIISIVCIKIVFKINYLCTCHNMKQMVKFWMAL